MREGRSAATSHAIIAPKECPTSIASRQAQVLEQLVVAEDQVPQAVDLADGVRVARASSPDAPARTP